MIHHIKTKADFDNQLSAAGGKLVVADFTATWCGPCKMIAPIFEEMAGKYEDVLFLKVDIDEAEEVANCHNVRSVPTFIFFKNGQKVDDFSGANKEKLQEFIERLK
ncbi:thioredoxin-like [Protopterus annectens]|uniref:thioredoxin-like n=1 Tax=Protopterus annectens TaxID=7888 RepID=UPI001CF9EFDD|nr:thioredoxin-like [Protopterus annectens]